MYKIITITSIIMAATLGLAISQPANAETPIIQTKGPIIHLADNLQEEAKLGWCIDTDGRGLSDLLHAHSCKPSGGDVLFTYVEETGQIASATYDNKCMAFNAPENAINPFGLVNCDSSAPEQKFVYETETLEMHFGPDETQCLTVSAEIDRAGPYLSRDLFLASCDSLETRFKQWVVKN